MPVRQCVWQTEADVDVIAAVSIESLKTDV